MTSYPFVKRTRAILRNAEFGFFGVIVFTSAFFALLVLSFTYAILSGRAPGAVAAHEQQLSGAALGLASLLMLLGLREVLRLYGGNRRMLEPANALIARVTRAAVAEALTEDFVRTARAKGLPERRVLIRHALANAAVPIVTMVGIGLSSLLGGIVVTETVFAIPGMGRLMIDAIIRRDFPILQGVILVLSALYVLINLAIDLSYSLFDPRIRY